MLKKTTVFLIIFTFMFLMLSQTVMAQGNELKVEWYDLVDRAYIEKYNGENIDEIYTAEGSKLIKTGVLTAKNADGTGLLFMDSGTLADLAKAEINKEDFYGMIITGTLTPSETGSYKFQLWSDDGVRLKIGDTWVVSFWGEVMDGGRTWEERRTGDAIQLEAGKSYPIRVEYFEGWGGNLFELTWSKDAGDFTKIPASVLSGPAADTGDGDGTDDGTDDGTPPTSDANMIFNIVLAGSSAFAGFKLKNKK
jgi:hypothetical protein